MIHLNLNMAVSLSDLEQHEQSLKYLERALELSHMAFGKHALSVRLAQIYDVAASGGASLLNVGGIFER